MLTGKDNMEQRRIDEELERMVEVASGAEGWEYHAKGYTTSRMQL